MSSNIFLDVVERVSDQVGNFLGEASPIFHSVLFLFVAMGDSSDTETPLTPDDNGLQLNTGLNKNLFLEKPYASFSGEDYVDEWISLNPDPSVYDRSRYTDSILEEKCALFQDDPTRFILYPLKYPDLFELVQKHRAGFWAEDEPDLSRDGADFWGHGMPMPSIADETPADVALCEGKPVQGMVAAMRIAFVTVIAFFAASDALVNNNIEERFRLFKALEIRMFIHYQEMIEDVHTLSYLRIIESLKLSEHDQSSIFQALFTMPAIRRKSSWFYEITRRGTVIEAIAAQIIAEALMFQGCFAIIFHFRSLGLLPGASFTNEKILTDEGDHGSFWAEVYRKVPPELRLPEEHVCNMLMDALQNELIFFKDVLSSPYPGMNFRLMRKYLKFHVNYVAMKLLDIEQPLFPKARNPFDFMDNVGLPTKANFFERRVGEYRKAGVSLPSSPDTSYTIATADRNERRAAAKDVACTLFPSAGSPDTSPLKRAVSATC